MELTPQHWIAIACAIGLLWLGFSLGRAQQRVQLRQAGRRAQERGERGERDAEKLLRSLGYRIFARHVTRTYVLDFDGEEREVQAVADLLVERDGLCTVAEVKTGRQAPNIGYAETRRQLLEYQLAFGVPSVLLVDVEAGSVHEVRFPLATDASPARTTRSLTLLVMAVIVIGSAAFALLQRSAL